jgi:SAM-dependent methyltransferase
MLSRDYDRIGAGYATTRLPDPRIAARINQALGDASSVVNVGAGAGSYEPRDRTALAVELSRTMIDQRASGAAPAVRASAVRLPLADGAVDAALAVLTIHHWPDRAQGLAEMRRVARGRVVVLTWDQEICDSFWLVSDYLPGIRDVDRPRAASIADIISIVGSGQVVEVPVPHDCSDGFLGAFWRRPEAYLDPRVRRGISAFWELEVDAVDAGLRRLAADIENGVWAERQRDLLTRDELDLGYRLIVAER